MTVQPRSRPFDALSETDAAAWGQKEYAELSEVGADGLTFAGKTSMLRTHLDRCELKIVLMSCVGNIHVPRCKVVAGVASLGEINHLK